ncbi:MAG: hypothetical protein IKG22_08350 [Atopobiaceae bacterium]|nr:hypothetical protein [Atopobiaceae bacterium]
MYSTLIAMALVRVVLTIALATVIIRSGYRIGYRDAVSGRPARIRVPRFDDEPDDPDDPAPHIAGLLPAIGETHNQEVSTMNATVSNPHTRTFEGTIADLAVRTTSKGETVAIFKLKGGPEEVNFVVFPRLFSVCGDLLANGAPVRVSGGLESGRCITQLVCRQIDSLA